MSKITKRCTICGRRVDIGAEAHCELCHEAHARMEKAVQGQGTRVQIDGQDLRARRIDKGLSQQGLGDLIELSASMIGAFERESSKPSVSQWEAINEALATSD